METRQDPLGHPAACAVCQREGSRFLRDPQRPGHGNTLLTSQVSQSLSIKQI